MGYNTDFSGSFKLNRIANNKEVDYINSFSETRRMRRNTDILMDRCNGKNGLPLPLTPVQAKAIKALENSGLIVSVMPKDNTNSRAALAIYGKEGEYYVGDDTIGVLNPNTPPSTQPSLYCHWIITNDGTELKWNGCEKFYDYDKWLQYLIDNFFATWGIKLNGIVRWSGDDSEDVGSIKITNNVIKIKKAKLIY